MSWQASSVINSLSLIGMPACGKSTLGRHIARRTGLRFVDGDRLIEQREGQTLARLLAQRGYLGLREAEERHEAFVNQFIALCEQQFALPSVQPLLQPGITSRLASRALHAMLVGLFSDWLRDPNLFDAQTDTPAMIDSPALTCDAPMPSEVATPHTVAVIASTHESRSEMPMTAKSENRNSPVESGDSPIPENAMMPMIVAPRSGHSVEETASSAAFIRSSPRWTET